MSDLEFRVLSLLRDGAEIKVSALSERLPPSNPAGETRLTLNHLQSQGLLTIDMGGNVKITGSRLLGPVTARRAKRKEETQRKENQAKEEAPSPNASKRELKIKLRQKARKNMTVRLRYLYFFSACFSALS